MIPEAIANNKAWHMLLSGDDARCIPEYILGNAMDHADEVLEEIQNSLANTDPWDDITKDLQLQKQWTIIKRNAEKEVNSKRLRRSGSSRPIRRKKRGGTQPWNSYYQNAKKKKTPKSKRIQRTNDWHDDPIQQYFDLTGSCRRKLDQARSVHGHMKHFKEREAAYYRMIQEVQSMLNTGDDRLAAEAMQMLNYFCQDLDNIERDVM